MARCSPLVRLAALALALASFLPGAFGAPQNPAFFGGAGHDGDTIKQPPPRNPVPSKDEGGGGGGAGGGGGGGGGPCEGMGAGAGPDGGDNPGGVSGESIKGTEPFDPPFNEGVIICVWPTSGDVHNDTGDPVLLHNGQVSYRATDMVIKGRGIDFALTRRYLSHRSEVTAMGAGWDFSYNTWLEFPGGYVGGSVDDSTIMARNGNGRFDKFSAVPFEDIYDSPHGIFSKLKRESAGDAYILRTRDGTKYEYKVISDTRGAQPEPRGRLEKITDRHGNQLQFTYGGAKPWKLRTVIDTLGRVITFKYGGGSEIISSVEGPFGQTVKYFYGAAGSGMGTALYAVETSDVNANCELESQYQPEARREEYSYHPTSYQVKGYTLLTGVKKPRQVKESGPFTVTFSYNGQGQTYWGPNGDWCSGQNQLDGGQIQYFYYVGHSDLDAPLDPSNTTVIVLENKVTDANGNVCHYFFNQYGNAVQVTAIGSLNETSAETIAHPLGGGFAGPTYTTLMGYNTDSQITSVSYPGATGDRITEVRQYTAGNLTSLTTYDRIGAQAKQVSYAYEPVYNHLCSYTDELGRTTEYYCDYMEGVRSQGDPNDVVAPIQEELWLPDWNAAYVLVAGLPFVPGGAGEDVNGDSIVNAVNGDVILIAEPNVDMLVWDGTSPQEADNGMGNRYQKSATTHTYNEFGQRTSTTDAEQNVTFYVYHPAGDPDGNGSPGGQTGAGGWLAQKIVDASFPHPQEPSLDPRVLTLDQGIGRNSGYYQAETNKTTEWFYNQRGFVTSQVDERGVKYLWARNVLDEVVRMNRATDVSAASTRLGTCEGTAESLAAFDFETVYCIDPNGMVYHQHTENVGNTPDQGGHPGYLDTIRTYDARNLVTQVKREYGPAGEKLVLDYEHDPNGNLEKATENVTGSDNVVVRYEYDSRDKLVKTIRELGGGSSPDVEWVNEYTTSGKLSRKWAGTTAGHPGPTFYTEYVRDDLDRVAEALNPDGSGYGFEYNARDQVTAKSYGTPTIVEKTVYHYDERGRLVQTDWTSVTQALNDGPLLTDGHVNNRYEYDRLSRPTYRIDDGDQVYTTRFDGAGRVVETVDPMSNVVELCYDDNDNLVKSTEIEKYPGGGTRTFEIYRVYDALNRQVSVTDQSGHTTRYTYDSRDNLVETTDANGDPGGGTINGLAVNLPGNKIQYRHDGLDRLLTTTRFLTPNQSLLDGEITTAQAWYENGLLKSRTDDNGNVTQYSYDGLGRMTRETLADFSYTEYEYRPDNLVERVRHSPDGSSAYDVVYRQDYNINNWLTDIVLETGAGVVGTGQLHFEHDDMGRVTRSVDDVDGVMGNGDDWEVLRTYDDLGRILTETQGGRTVTNVWEEESRRTTLGYPSPFAVRFDHDDLDRICCIRDSSLNIFAHYEYAGKGRVLERDHPENGTTMRYHDGSWDDTLFYDDSRRPTRVDHMLGSTEQTRLEHGYDRMFNRTYEKRTIELSTGGSHTEWDNYGYDEVYRLTAFERDNLLGTPGTLGQGNQAELREYEIDGVQNWGELIIDGQPTTTAVNSVNEYTAFGSDAPQYDGRGNMIESGGTPNITYRYDFLNRLREVEDVVAFKKVKYTYDAHGRRVATDDVGQAAIPEIPDRTEFVYDGIQVIEERAVGQGGLARRFVLGRSIDEPVRLENVSFYSGAGVYYYQSSTLGNVVGVADASGAVVERYTYDAYGLPRFEDVDGVPQSVSSSAVGNPILFTARRYESELREVYYYRARFLDPERGRFCSRDPIGIWGDGASIGNAYAYVGNGPVNLTDPTGKIVYFLRRHMNPDNNVWWKEIGGNLGGGHTGVGVARQTPDGDRASTWASDAPRGSDRLLVSHEYYTNPDDGRKEWDWGITVIPPPHGVSQEEWDAAVSKAAGDVHRKYGDAKGEFAGEEDVKYSIPDDQYCQSISTEILNRASKIVGSKARFRNGMAEPQYPNSLTGRYNDMGPPSAH